MGDGTWFERIGGMIGMAFYAAQAVAMGGGLAVMVLGGKGAGDAWLRWTVPPMIALGVALMYGMSTVGAVRVFWRLLTDKEYGDG